MVLPPSPGIRRDSFFASNTSGLKSGEDLLLLQNIGLKVQRVHFNPRLVSRPPAVSTGEPLPLDFSEQDRLFAEAKVHDSWPLSIAGYAFENARAPLADQTGMYGPPRDPVEFSRTWERILRHYPEITTYEFWNEPWIFGWTWAADGETYRTLQKSWCEMALGVNPSLRLLAGNSSMFTEDHIEIDPSSWKGLLSGTTHHPYSWSGSRPSWIAGDSNRSIDFGMAVTRRMGLPFYYLTEGGTENENPAQGKNTNANAYKVVQYFLHEALTGAFMGNAQWEIGYGPTWTRSNVAFATMTHFLEDRPVVADIWPENEQLWGAVFATAAQVTPEVRARPRAAELKARWSVPAPAGRAADTTKVAVVWRATGVEDPAANRAATLSIGQPADIRAYDLTGREIPRRGGKLVVPLGEYPVYLLSNDLDVVALRKRVADGRIEGMPPVAISACSLTDGNSPGRTLTVRVENELNEPVAGVLHCRVSGASVESTSPFSIPAARLADVTIPWPGGSASGANRWKVTLRAVTPRGSVTRQQSIQSARFAKQAVRFTGSLNDWQGLTPVSIDSQTLPGDADLTQYVLNPSLARPAAGAPGKRVRARVFTAYDADQVYIGAAVEEDALHNSAGTPATRLHNGQTITLPYTAGVPDGLDHITNLGDCFSFSFGFRERVPDWGRQMNDLWAWKGHFYDTDYHYVANVSAQGDMLMRQWGPDTGRRTGYQTEHMPGAGPVPGAKILIHREESTRITLYEIAIPRSELSLFTAEQGRCRFGFQIRNDEQAAGGNLQWAEEAGVFPHWRSSGSFSPSWNQVLPCQTFFGIER